jgi:hypothetical protein
MRRWVARKIKKLKNSKIPISKSQRNPNDQMPNVHNQDGSTHDDLVCKCLKISMFEFRDFLTLGFWIWELQAACSRFIAKT